MNRKIWILTKEVSRYSGTRTHEIVCTVEDPLLFEQSLENGWTLLVCEIVQEVQPR
jgi:hypothetical protein